MNLRELTKHLQNIKTLREETIERLGSERPGTFYAKFLRRKRARLEVQIGKARRLIQELTRDQHE